MAKLGFIGLGIMGNPMAKNLMAGGHELLVFDKDPAAVKSLTEAGAKAAASPAEIAAEVSVVFIIVNDSENVRSVLCDKSGLFKTCKPGAIIVDMSLISPLSSKEFANLAAKRGTIFFDAPVSGGESHAIAGTLNFTVGGPAYSLEKIRPYLELMGNGIIHVGLNGSGSMTRLAARTAVNLNIAAMSELIVLSVKSGVDPEAVFRAIRVELSRSLALDSTVPAALSSGFANCGSTNANMQDIKNVLETSHCLDVPLPLTANLNEIFTALRAVGFGHDDSGIIKFYEKLAGITVTYNKEEPPSPLTHN